ncbi:MAG TPA: hypothetical protein VF219_10140, partial [Vicinamibacterales bacterium]
METRVETTSTPWIEAKFVVVGQGWNDLDRKLDFDRKEIRKGMREVGKFLQKATRSLISGDPKYPVNRTGSLRKGIRYRVGSQGFYVKIRVEKVDKEDFYPAFLYYGVRDRPHGGKIRAYRPGRKLLAGAWRIEPRGN